VNNGPLLFLGILASLAASFWGLLIAPQLQIGQQQPAVIEATGEIYPSGRPGLARQGAEVYRSLGCVECHSQQVRQTGVSFDVWLADPGTNRATVSATLTRLGIAPAEVARAIDQAPVRLRSGLSQNEAQAIASQITNDDAKAQAVLENLGPDITRGWGRRVTVTQDYLSDYPVQLGNLRVGPDLANYGSRSPGLAEILKHLYAPQMMVKDVRRASMMPPYRFLFDKRRLREGETASLPIEPGYEVTPKPEAEALAAYLMSLRADIGLKEAPVPNPPTKSAPAPAPGQPAAIPAPAPAPAK
jgi:cytochrome c oxidase cbb3-type subunit 2